MKYNTPLSQTTEILYREPTYEEKYGKNANLFGHLSAFFLLFIICLALGFITISKSEQGSANQVESMVKTVTKGSDK